MTEIYDIALRVDGQDSSSLVRVLDQDGGAYLVVKELEGSNPHYHAVLHSSRKPSAVRAALKRAMPELNGNGSYSVTLVRDLAKYQRYMLKGESCEVMPNIVAAHGMAYTNLEWQEEQHDAYWAENDELLRKRKKGPIFEAVLAQCRTDRISWQNRTSIAEIYIRHLVEADKAINLFSLKSYVNLIQVKLCPGDQALQDLAAQV